MSAEDCCGSHCFTCPWGFVMDFASMERGYRVDKRVVNCRFYNTKIEFDADDADADPA